MGHGGICHPKFRMGAGRLYHINLEAAGPNVRECFAEIIKEIWIIYAEVKICILWVVTTCTSTGMVACSIKHNILSIFCTSASDRTSLAKNGEKRVWEQFSSDVTYAFHFPPKNSHLQLFGKPATESHPLTTAPFDHGYTVAARVRCVRVNYDVRVNSLP